MCRKRPERQGSREPVPEGPEIRRVADRLAEALAGRRIEEAFFAFEALKPYQAELEGSEVISVSARAKALLIGCDCGLTVYSHNQLYGRWEIVGRGERPDTGRQLRLGLHTAEQSCLLFSASDIQVLDRTGIETHPFLSRLGPDVLAGDTCLEGILERCRKEAFRGRQLGSLLLDQGFLAGLGNYLRSEILFRAGVGPRARPRELGGRRLRALAREILATAAQAYETGGVTNDLRRFRRLRGQGLSFGQARHWVFGREGEPCYLCGYRIERTDVSSRRLYYCPACQPES